MNGILIWLDAYKTYLAAIALPVIALLVQTGVINAEAGTLIATIIGVITGGGKAYIDSQVKQETNLGVSISNARLNK
jgi:hypothetical protein